MSIANYSQVLVNTGVKIAFMLLLAGGSMGGCRCGRDVIVDDAEIDLPSIAEEKPKAPRPQVVFPASQHCNDAELNEFVDRALKICERGDYDAFRQLFGTEYEPIPQQNFKNVWYDVQEIRVAGIYQPKGPAGQAGSSEYFLHTVVQLRKPDRKGREKLHAVLVLYREAGHWCMRPAPGEIAQKILVASTQPASQPAQAAQLPDN